MRAKVDLLPVSLRELKVSAFHRVWIKVGFGIQIRARTTASGYDLRIRYGKDDTIKKSTIRVEYGAHWANGNPRPTLSCSGCGKLAFQNLYLDEKDWRWKCAACHGVKPWKIRVPMKWDISEETKFRKLLRRKLDEDILTFELAALRQLSPSEFFGSRPYLVPEWVALIEKANPELHKKLLRVLHNKYRSVMMKRRIQFLNEKENKWLMERLGTVFEKASIIAKKDIKWLKQQKSPTGNQSGTELEQSSSLPMETDCSSRKMSSGQDMSVARAAALVSESVRNVVVREDTAEASESSSAPNATTEE